MLTTIKNGVRNLIAPTSLDENRARQEFILNILLCSTGLLALIATAINSTKEVFGLMQEHYDTSHVAPVSLLIITTFIVSLYTLSKKGYAKTSSLLLILVFFLSAGYLSYGWGADLESALLLDVLLIIISGILIGTKASFIIAAAISVEISAIAYLHNTGLLDVNRDWRSIMWGWGESIAAAIIFMVIVTITWLSNREISYSLKRARTSEAALKEERDLLEVRIEERTRQLKQAQFEETARLYRFAEFGRLYGGIFHDLASPLTVVSMNLNKAKQVATSHIGLEKMSIDLGKAVEAVNKMGRFINSVRKQIAGQGSDNLFSINSEIESVIQILEHRANKEKVLLDFIADEDINIMSNQIKFSQVAANLISNAIDSYHSLPDSAKRRVLIKAFQKEKTIKITVKDWGSGISADNLSKIFLPFFSTKDFEHGTGIGLSITKQLVEENLKGRISVDSQLGRGTAFIISLPI